MKKSTKIIIEVVGVIIIFVVASILYNKLDNEALSSSYVPTVNEEVVEDIVSENATISNDNSGSTEVANNNEKQDVDVSKDEESVDSETSQSSLMPDIPVIMYPSKSESTFWEVVPKGKPVVINLFASWCPPCKAEMPHFVEARETYKDEVTFIFFDSFDGSRETEETLKAFVDKTFKDDTLIVMDPGYMGYIFNSNSIPLTIILDKNGDIVSGFQGAINKETLVTEIEKLL